MVCLPPLIKDQLDANHIQEWSQGTPEWKEEKEGNRERSEGWNNEEIAQWAQNIKITKKARRISQAANDSKLVNKVSIPAHDVRTLWDMIDNVLDQSKQVGKMTDKIISHINKQKDEMLEEEANMRLREHNIEAKEEELRKKFAQKAAKRKAAKKQAALK